MPRPMIQHATLVCSGGRLGRGRGLLFRLRNSEGTTQAAQKDGRKEAPR